MVATEDVAMNRILRKFSNFSVILNSTLAFQ